MKPNWQSLNYLLYRWYLIFYAYKIQFSWKTWKSPLLHLFYQLSLNHYFCFNQLPSQVMAHWLMLKSEAFLLGISLDFFDPFLIFFLLRIFSLPFIPLYTLQPPPYSSPHNHHPVVCVHEGFFFFLYPSTPNPHSSAVRLLSIYESIVYLHYGISLGYEKEDFILRESMDGPAEHYAKWIKPLRERQIPHDFRLFHVLWCMVNFKCTKPKFST